MLDGRGWWVELTQGLLVGTFIMTSSLWYATISWLLLCGFGEEKEGACVLKGGECGNENGVFYKRGGGNGWNYYLDLINTSLSQYHTCEEEGEGYGGGCGCFTPVISADLAVWSQRGGIHQEDFLSALDRAYTGVHYQVIDHVLLRQTHCSFMARCKGVEHFLLSLVDTLPNMEFIINVRDYPLSSKHSRPLPYFSFSKTPLYFDLMYPAWSFWSGGPSLSTEPQGIGRWDLKREALRASSEAWPWEQKKNISFFRGSRTSSERDPLILLSRENPDLVNAQYTKNQAWRSEEGTLGAAPADIVPLEDHCQYKYLFNFRGVAASFRLKHLFLCKSLVLHVGEEWAEFFYPSLYPWIHYVPLPHDLQGTRKVLEFLSAHDEVAKEIAARGYSHIWRLLSMEAISCYWNELLKRYSELCTWEIQKQNTFIIIEKQ